MSRIYPALYKYEGSRYVFPIPSVSQHLGEVGDLQVIYVSPFGVSSELFDGSFLYSDSLWRLTAFP